MPIYSDSFPVSAGDYASAGEVSARIKGTLKMIGVDPALIRRITIAAYEAELNMIISSESITLGCKDTGPGIEDIGLAMQEGYSTASTSIRMMGFGAGMGLPNMKRYSDGMCVDTVVGRGTKIHMTVNIPRQD